MCTLSFTAEAAQNVVCRQLSKRTERGDPESTEHAGEIGSVEQVDVHRCEELGGGSRRYHSDRGSAPSGQFSGKGPIGHPDAHIGTTADNLGHPRSCKVGHRIVTTEVARRAPGNERTRAGAGDLDPGGDVVEYGDNRFEQTCLFGLVSVVDRQLGASGLGHPSSQTSYDPVGASAGRRSDDPVGEQNHRRFIERYAGGNKWPIRTPRNKRADGYDHQSTVATG